MTQKLPRPAKAQRRKAEWRQQRGSSSFKQGHAAEWLAAFWLMLHGYRILAFRLKTRAGEIDVLAKKRNVLAVVEVKQRNHMQASLYALKASQYDRLKIAAETIKQSRSSLLELELRIDLIAMSPGRLPRHIRGVTRTGQ